MDYRNDNKWKAHLSGQVTHGQDEHQVYQREYAIFNVDGTMRLKAEYAGELIDTSDYTIPVDGNKNPDDSLLYYYSGAICIGQTGKQQITYGYFEAKCKIPVNCGAFPAFWLWGETGDPYPHNYREIDIFEYSRGTTIDTSNIHGVGTPRFFGGQIYYYNGAKPEPVANCTYGRYRYNIPSYEPDLTHWHVYGLEWSPGRVKWYFDNKLVGSFVGDSIPSAGMNLVLNNAVDSYATPNGVPMTSGFPNEMCIDYVKVSKLKCNCGTDAVIQNNTQLSAFNFKVYRNITIGGYGYGIDIPSSSHTVFRATNGITINGGFDLPPGSSLELITHPCPE
jgi:beta-glucanase (GH16 family)